MVKGDSKDSANPSVVFHINGEKHTVGGDQSSGVGARTALVDYIRDTANLKGTKVMCREGGCGACTVTAKVVDPVTGAEVVKSVNSCLTPVLSCDGWDISTVESLGNKQDGYHVIQNRLVNFHGTQCGYCTPGMVMNMYGLLGAKKNLEMEDVEKNLDGNICRCTGYRPILDAFKSMANDASPDLRGRCSDIEDCATCPLKKQNATGYISCGNHAKVSSHNLISFPSGEEWLTAKTLESALVAAAQCVQKGAAYRFVAGNTSTGIFKNDGPYRLYIDTTGIPELRRTSVDAKGIVLGGGTSLTATINLLRDASKLPGLEYGKRVATHLERVANVSVRNNGTIAGNLMIKHNHHDFPSDIFVLLEAIGATLTLASLKGKCVATSSSVHVPVDTTKTVTLLDFLKTDMTAKLVLSVNLPIREGYHFRSFKITRRYQNAHAYVNAAFLLKVDKSAGYMVVEKPRIVYGGISHTFHHACLTETCLHGKKLSEDKTIRYVLQALDNEVKPEVGPLESAPSYRVQLTKGLLYKTILEIIGVSAPERFRSGGLDILRKVSQAKQFLDKNESDVALYKYVPKYEGGIQSSGEAEYTGDIPVRPDELFAAYVLSTVGCADIKNMDASEALKIPGVVRFVTAKDIPGENNAMKYNMMPIQSMPEPVFAFDKVSYHGQALGLILATSREVSHQAAKLVKVTYENIQKPVVKITEAIEKAKASGSFLKQTAGKFSTKPLAEIKHVHTLKGNLSPGSQYHFYMETQSCVCYPREDGLDVHCGTQWLDHVQITIATVLGIPTNGINVQCRRIGGGFGGKATKTTIVTAACAVATWVTNRPVRLVMDLETNMSMLGKRLPYEMPYEVGFDDEGRIASLKIDLICDAGYSYNEATSFFALAHLQNVYKAAGWVADSHFVTTNTPANTACRAPGSIQAVAVIEWIMDHIAYHLKKDPLEVREVNLLASGDAQLFGAPIFERENFIPKMIEQMKATADYDGRKKAVEKFNLENRWKKRGISVVPVRYPIEYFATNYPASLAIYHTDGYVAVTHGGVEMGQGLNTKVIQTVAQVLQIPMDRVKIKPTNNFNAANGMPSGGSVTSEVVCYSVMRACEEIRENLKPILEKLENPSWEKLIEEAHNAKVKLTATFTPGPKDDPKGYDVWIVAVNEVEIDVLTGEYKVARTDLYEDVGKSLSPGIDLGQVEGGYIFGQGFWTTEKIVHDEKTGKVLTNGTWDYKPPEVKDIPEDFRITLLSNVPNPNGILRSKATGEPSTDSAFGVVLALRNAIASARADGGNKDWFEMSGPVTPEDVAQLCLTKSEQLIV